MKIPAVKYMRDFYPEEMRIRQWIEDAWRAASERAGFVPWDAPILEHLDLYVRKSGDEIVSQLYSLTDRGGRELAIRPEMTPSLARMIAQRQAALPRPIKWYCIARMCRYERGQRGRLREFFQWNVDVLGASEPVADAEVLSVALDGLEALGLTSEDVEARINSRSLMSALLTSLGVEPDRHGAVFAVLDKRGKLSEEDLQPFYERLELPGPTLDRLQAAMACETLDDVERFASEHGVVGFETELGELRTIFECLASLGKANYCRFDVGVVRGLAYYTGPVFELFDRSAKLRAICGGGRYDRLLDVMGGESMPAVGFGLGDVVLGELLKEKKLSPPSTASVDAYVIPLEDARLPDALCVTRKLRSRGVATEYPMKAGSLAKALKRAAASGAAQVIIVGGQEWSNGMVVSKNMRTGEQSTIPYERI